VLPASPEPATLRESIISISDQVSVRRVLIEAVVIVGSILLAFGIDAYWDQRKEGAEEREVLIGLESDFVDLRARLYEWGTINETGVRLIGQFLSDSLAGFDRAIADSALFMSVGTNILDQGGPLEALLASGRLELIQNQEIRARLGKWPDWLEDIHTNDRTRRESADRNIVPLLSTRGWPSFDWRGCPSAPCVPTGEMPASYLSMAQDPQLRALLNLRRASMRGAVEDHLGRIPEADQLLQLIGEELAVR